MTTEETRARVREAVNRYRKNHPEEWKEHQRKWRENHRDHVREYQRNYKRKMRALKKEEAQNGNLRTDQSGQ